MNIIFSPLEQFTVLPLFLNLFNSAVSITIFSNALLILILLSAAIIIYPHTFVKNIFSNTGYIIASDSAILFEYAFIGVGRVIKDIVKTRKRRYFFPILITFFTLILTLNLQGLIPYSYTVTGQIIVTILYSLIAFTGIQITAFKMHNLKYLGSFFPSGTSLGLGFLLVPIEIISFFFKPISLSVRLFANMMAGHTLLKVIAGFLWSLVNSSSIFSIFHALLLVILVILLSLETVVGFIQALVFLVLLCIYLDDVFNLH